MAIRYISLFDACFDKESKEAILSDDLGRFYSLLYDAGFDIDREIVFQDVFCRSFLHPQIICRGRWVSFERIDKEWIESGNCSFENRLDIVAREDPSLSKDLLAMSTLPNFMGAVMSSMENLVGGEEASHYVDIEEDAIIEMLRVSDLILKSKVWER